MLPGATELMLLLGIAALVFGVDRVTKVARSSGKAVGEYRKERERLEEELDAVEEAARLDDGDRDNGAGEQ